MASPTNAPQSGVQSAKLSAQFRRDKSPKAPQGAKEKNFVYAQMMKIDKMDRDIEKRHKEQMMEIKNKDIEEIIQRTRREMKIEEAALHTQFGMEDSIPHQLNNNFGGNTVYFDNEELDNMIDQN